MELILAQVSNHTQHSRVAAWVTVPNGLGQWVAHGGRRLHGEGLRYELVTSLQEALQLTGGRSVAIHEGKSPEMTMEIGVAVPPVTDAEEFARLVQAAEEAGIDAFWTYDDGHGEEPFSRIGFLASITRRATLCAGIVNPFLRHPAVLAGGAATLDRLSGGRLRLVMGLGWTPELKTLGVSRRRPYAEFQASITIIKALVAGEEVSHEGPHFALYKARLRVAPIQSVLPIYVAGGGRRAMEIASSSADGYLAEFGPDPRYVSSIRDLARSIRGNDTPMRLGFIMGFRVDSLEAGLASARRSLAWALATSTSTDPYYSIAGVDADLLAAVRSTLGLDELIRGRRDPKLPFRDPSQLEAAGRLLPADLVAALAPNMNLVGPIPWAAQRLREIAASGVDFVVLQLPTRFHDTLPGLPELVARVRQPESSVGIPGRATNPG